MEQLFRVRVASAGVPNDLLPLFRRVVELKLVERTDERIWNLHGYQANIPFFTLQALQRPLRIRLCNLFGNRKIPKRSRTTKISRRAGDHAIEIEKVAVIVQQAIRPLEVETSPKH